MCADNEAVRAQPFAQHFPARRTSVSTCDRVSEMFCATFAALCDLSEQFVSAVHALDVAVVDSLRRFHRFALALVTPGTALCGVEVVHFEARRAALQFAVFATPVDRPLVRELPRKIRSNLALLHVAPLASTLGEAMQEPRHVAFLSAASIVAIRPDAASRTVELVDSPQIRLTRTHLPATYSTAVALKVVHNVRVPAKTDPATHPFTAAIAVAVVVVEFQ
jgi:hypothetical protein